MWIGLADASYGTAISNGWFNYAYQNHGNGWYWVAVGSNSYVSAGASGYNQGSFYTDGHDSGRLYLTKPTPSGGGGSKK